MPLLALHGIRAAYGRRVVLDDVSLAVETGEVVALVGRNGAGKTTLLRVAAGHMRPTAGRVELLGRDLATCPVREAARHVSGVAQEEDAGAPFLVREVVAMGRHPWLAPWRPLDEADHAAVDAALAATGLRDFAHRRLDELSGGERARASLARCLAQDTEVLLLDEPTAHVDLGHVADVLSVVRRLARARGKGALVAFHDWNLAGAFADRVVVLDAGRVVASGAPREVITAERLTALYGAGVRLVDVAGRAAPVVLLEERP